MRLPDVCAIQTGYTARSRLDPAAGGVLAIQLRDIATDGRIDAEHLTRVDLGHIGDRYFVRSGDVLFRSRGDHNTASALDERFAEPAVAVLPLMVLRANRSLVTPEYLAWAINQPEAQRQFDVAARGTSIRMVPKSSLDDLEIDLPDLETQRRIVMTDELAAREATLMRLLADRKRDLTNRLLAESARRTLPSNLSKRTGT